ncbi:CDP-diacylglycerol--glycerol-3-phosphate 3-phosphatidyltransferase [Jiangella asiatica]|uniref:CDP-diacylglycerol--glycerol-3-phosphate 3-phosphatidyltransferase n=1 Tax=Jiangella asiatica TaxID=2530372 RepID=A0A4R5DPE4_9ACTN|nr:CDP-diacylglycerol--glycerol-3-phosphate 3-phosphatidyltransferase [Jiangella asiatica]TDE14040.1 CDP-diacylglycerol--glycerol-3-phosphate 3-phosphatidyltransferase [Jiangella asiatica]
MPEPSTAPPSPWNIANALTALRLVLVPLFGWLLLRDGGDHDPSRVVAFFVFGLAMLTDRLDGDLARRRGLVTDLGKIADPIADKALTGMAFVGLSLLDELPWWVTVVVLVREWGITLLRFAVIRYGIIPASRGGKLKTALQALALGLYILPLPSAFEPVQAVCMAVAVIVTVVTGVDYVLSAIRLRRDATSGPA